MSYIDSYFFLNNILPCQLFIWICTIVFIKWGYMSLSVIELPQGSVTILGSLCLSSVCGIQREADKNKSIIII